MGADSIKKFIATKGICCVAEDSPIQFAAESMIEGNCSSLIIIGKDNHVSGIVTERDFTRKVVAKGNLDGNIGDICTRKLETISPNASSHEALSLMHKHKIRHLPVIEDDKVVGVVSMRDLYDSLENRLKTELDEVRAFVFGDRYGGN
ncbi:MAG: cyclic nucleotide-binding/CBS domain-containing protein [Alphaproteobacteria bacterium]